VVVEIEGPARAVLTAERTLLNLLCHLSGIASLTAEYVAACGDVQVLDTRKTTPGMRELEKAAVKAGGGVNHRMGLYDRVLVKDNHLALAGAGLAEAVARARRGMPEVLVEVEADDLAGVRLALEAGADWILLDNMTPEQMREAVALTGGRALLEASGGMTLDGARAAAATGVDAVSVGALTHSAPALDLGLDIDV
ncbi:MAG: carboxylating nicotinate-nucleotide diphosphorylase, partial [Thermoleophilia bacterium]|nr:carboxylating nicotinate-nucleotide diphosphorylase [Thermoleophilia bacterium]